MKNYTITLLKDLPTVKAGFTFNIEECQLEEWYRWRFKSQINGMTEDEFNKKVRTILEYKDNNEWVKVEINLSKAIQIQCPECKNIGMFPYFHKDLIEYYDADVTTWYKKLGLECPHCNHILYTHEVCVDKKIKW